MLGLGFPWSPHCFAGYSDVNGLACADINECAFDNGLCDLHVTCTNPPVIFAAFAAVCFVASYFYMLSKVDCALLVLSVLSAVLLLFSLLFSRLSSWRHGCVSSFFVCSGLVLVRPLPRALHGQRRRLRRLRGHRLLQDQQRRLQQHDAVCQRPWCWTSVRKLPCW